MAALVITDLRCRFDRPVLTGVDLTVASGSVTTILGASGSGKSTLLRLVCGFERAQAGRIVIEDRVVAGPGVFVPPERRHVGYVAQDGALFPHLSVADNILFGLRRGARTPARAGELLHLVGLPGDYARRPPQELSGGEQQRVALARALAPAPRIVLLDEPFSALDAALRVDTRRAVLRALAAAGATAVLVTHDQGEALSMGDQVAVLRDGVLVQVAAPGEIYQHPVDSALARFVGEAVLLDGFADGRQVRCALGVLPRSESGPDGAVEVLIRPEQIRLLAAVPGGTCGTVAEITYYGHDAAVRLEMDAGVGVARVMARVSGHAVPRVGERRAVEVEGDVVSYGH